MSSRGAGKAAAEDGPTTMDPTTLRTPVVLLIFNRPDTTARVFEAIAAVRPRRLLVVADGPRVDRPDEVEACAATRAATERVDWPCDVRREYAEVNLGCARRVSSGLTWAFDLVEEAIVLEDDCLPDPTFFRFCEELLDRYKDDERVMAISGDNFQGGHQRTADSYYFSIFNHYWGWATWRRAWRLFDLRMSLWPEIRDGGWLRGILGNPNAVRYWTDIFDRAHRDEFDSWGYPWTFSCWVQGGLAVLPEVNLVSNIGFDARATHTKAAGPNLMVRAEAMEFPLRHPRFLLRNNVADEFTLANHFEVPMHLRSVELLGRLSSRLFRFLESRSYRFCYRQLSHLRRAARRRDAPYESRDRR